jgi:hypothetical protein
VVFELITYIDKFRKTLRKKIDKNYPFISNFSKQLDLLLLMFVSKYNLKEYYKKKGLRNNDLSHSPKSLYNLIAIINLIQ